MNRPSSTITTAFLVGLLISALFGTINEFTDIVISPGYVATITTLVASMFGYLKKENVLPLKTQ